MEDEAALRCTNPECPAQTLRNIIHFASRAAMDIDGFGPAVARQLVERGLVQYRRRYLRPYSGTAYHTG
jgi:DNA ligase (NAD+)